MITIQLKRDFKVWGLRNLKGHGFIYSQSLPTVEETLLALGDMGLLFSVLFQLAADFSSFEGGRFNSWCQNLGQVMP